MFGVFFYWLLSTYSGQSAFLSFIIVVSLQAIFGIWDTRPNWTMEQTSIFENGMLITFFTLWGIIYALAKIGSKMR